MNLDEIKTELDDYGFVILENQLSRSDADLMAQRIVEIADDQPNRDRLDQTVLGLLEQDDLFLPLITNPTFLELARYKLGDNVRMTDVGAKLVKPGGVAQTLHADVPLGRFPEPLPNTCFLLNSIWMLSDFTRDVGATVLLPFSHHSLRRPRRGVQYRHLVAAEAPRGSIVIFHGAIWHGAGANVTTDRTRIGVSVAYFPSWLDPAVGGWSTMPRSVYDRMPPLVQQLNAHRVVDNKP